MYHGMNEHNSIQVECENNSTVNKKDRIYHSLWMWFTKPSYFMPTICVEYA
jgi:hypothetical protein